MRIAPTIPAQSTPTRPQLKPYEREVGGILSVAADDTLDFLKSGRNVLGYLAGVTDTSLMGRWVLSHLGPAGPFGPLGEYGPFGQGETGNASELITGHNWEDLQRKLTRHGGPLSDKGPLSEHGPLGNSFLQRLLRMNRATWSLMPGQPLGVLGPGGVDGPLGIMGPMGPNGAHGHKLSESGEYLDETCRTVEQMDVAWTAEEKKTRQLFEIVPERCATKLGDTSLMIKADHNDEDLEDSFQIKTDKDEWVTFHVVPARSKVEPSVLKELIREVRFRGRSALTSERLEDWNRRAEGWFDRFGLEVLDEHGAVVADSNTAEGPNWLQMKLPADRKLQVRVRCAESWQEGEKPYRLFVTGSGSELHDFATATASESRPSQRYTHEIPDTPQTPSSDRVE